MNKEALIIVDVQNDFCPMGSLPVTEGDLVVEPVNRMIMFARREKMPVIFTRDWHPKKTTHFLEYGGLWPAHCIQGSYGAEFHPQVDARGAVIFSKGTKENEDAYSGFAALNEQNEDLEKFLKNFRIEKIYVAGLALDYCVKNTALDAQKHFDTTVLIDACRAVNVHKGDGQKAIEEMIKAGIKISGTKEVSEARRD